MYEAFALIIVSCLSPLMFVTVDFIVSSPGSTVSKTVSVMECSGVLPPGWFVPIRVFLAEFVVFYLLDFFYVV